MHFAVLLFGALFLSLGVSAQEPCTTSVPVYEIFSAPDGVLTVNDEEGERQFRAMLFNTPDCDINPIQPTGIKTSDNYTIISQAGTGIDSCEVKDIGGVKTVNSFQAVVVDTNGFPMENVSIDYVDIDASGMQFFREAGIIFGVHDGNFVAPDVSFGPDTLLEVVDYFIPASSMSVMGLSVGASNVKGAGFVDSRFINCAWKISPVSLRCGATMSFSSPIDTLVIMYALTTRGDVSSRSASKFGDITMSCGCRCRETDAGIRMIASPVPGTTGECVSKETSGLKPECDVLGTKWCRKEAAPAYQLTGTTLPNGNSECEMTNGTKLVIDSPFSASSSFSGIS